jgi:xanthine dehydrogenase YagR molybdenum-binding subunit
MNKKVTKSRFFFEQDMQETVGEVSTLKPKPWGPGVKLDVVGKPVTRFDGYDKVSGSATYTFDVQLPRMVYARTLRSPHPHAKIRAIHAEEALKVPGVVDIISSSNIKPIPWYYDTSMIFDPHVRFEGDEVACVAAETPKAAEEALRLIRVEYDILPFVVSAGDALKKNAPKLYKNGNILRGKPDVYSRGDISKGNSESDFVVEDTFSTSVAIHNPTEPHGSVVNWDGDQLTVWDSTQAVFRVRDTVASALKIPDSHVRVIKKYMGGAFGSKLAAGKYTVMAAVLARRIGRPVKIIMDRREQNIAMGNRPDSVQHLKAGAKKDGTLTFLTHDAYGAAGAYPSGAGCSWPARTMYRCANVKTSDTTAFINAGPGRPFRAPGHVQGTFALESLIDELAEKAGMDPLTFRMKNITDKDQVFKLPYTTKLLKESYEAGAKEIGWKQRNRTPGSGTGPVKRGIGMASQIWWGGGGPPAYATLKLNRDGSAHVIAGTQDLGTGTYTIMAQVAAEVLDIPIDHIAVTLGDTGTCPYCGGSGGSTTAPSVTPAVRDAAERMLTKLRSAASAILEVSEADLDYRNGTFTVKTDAQKKADIGTIMRKMREQVLVTTGARNANPEGFAINTFGAQFADVQVDTLTGSVLVKRVVAAHDIGRVLNRKLLENQFHGGIIQGLGFALMEGRVMDPNTGKVLTTDFHEYKVPTMMNKPDIKVIIVSEGDTRISAVGAKGIGEPAMIPTAAAIANAIYNAIGVRLHSLPMTPDKVLNALEAAGRKS